MSKAPPWRAIWHEPVSRPPLLEAVSVSKRFAGGIGRESTLALADTSLAITSERPSIVAVVGESGSGKTTLARLLLGLAEPSGGEVRYRGRDLRKLTREDRRAFRRDVQAVDLPHRLDRPAVRLDLLLERLVPLPHFV